MSGYEALLAELATSECRPLLFLPALEGLREVMLRRQRK
jgi:hypothetical protein